MRFQNFTAFGAVGAIALAGASPAHADDSYRINEPLQQSALKWEMSYLALSAIDAAQTIECLNRDRCQEANPIMGKSPSTAKILLVKAGLGLVHFTLFRTLNRKDPKLALRTAQISAGLQAGVVMLNARVAF